MNFCESYAPSSPGSITLCESRSLIRSLFLHRIIERGMDVLSHTTTAIFISLSPREFRVSDHLKAGSWGDQYLAILHNSVLRALRLLFHWMSHYSRVGSLRELRKISIYKSLLEFQASLWHQRQTQPWKLEDPLTHFQESKMLVKRIVIRRRKLQPVWNN